MAKGARKTWELVEIDRLPSEIQDGVAISLFLMGSTTSSLPCARPRRPRTIYALPDSADDEAGRHALGRLLRSKIEIPQAYRLMLANLFDPEGSPADDLYRVDRKLVFRKVRRGADSTAHFIVANMVARFLGKSGNLTQAIEKTAHQCCLGAQQVERIWHDHKELDRKIRGMPPPSRKATRKKTHD